jgi:hypothetical protein
LMGQPESPQQLDISEQYSNQTNIFMQATPAHHLDKPIYT